MSFDRPGYLYYHLSTSAQSVGKSSWLAILFLRNKPLSLHCRWPNITRQVVYYNLKKEILDNSYYKLSHQDFKIKV